MTECERLIANGTFTPDFFKEEVRCDFLVTKERKKIWAIELDLLSQFDCVCKKYGLNYWLLGGSVIGAVRHKGFIPWDDDIDIIMPRVDYEKFKTLKVEFACPYFLQVPGEDGDYFFSFAKIRNSRTTCIHKPFVHESFNQGIGIDVFVLDAVNIESGQDEFNQIAKLARQNSSFMRRKNPSPTDADLRRIMEAVDVNPICNLREIDRIATRHGNENTPFVGEMTCTGYSFARQVWRKEWFAGAAMMAFEGHEYPVPVGWDAYLKAEFGDYMQFPPMEQRGAKHDTLFFNPDVPYLDSIDKARKEWRE